MAYAAVISLKQTIELLQNSPRISIDPPCPEIDIVYEEIRSIQEFLERLGSSERVNALDGEIREAVCRFEDVLESHLSNQLLSQSESRGDPSQSFKIDLKEVEEAIYSFMEAVGKSWEEYCKEDQLAEEDDAVSSTSDFGDVSSRSDSGGNKSKMVGLSDQFRNIKDTLVDPRQSFLFVVPLLGRQALVRLLLPRKFLKIHQF
ncbi:hypothetical protein Pfo_020888 [Paulownia fortunei]|nr:hypothetical protein Pfo_020888 [Paulownia fortunei]